MTIITTVTGKRIQLQHKKPGSKPLPESVKKRRVNICLSPYWYQIGKERATARKLSFSAYFRRVDLSRLITQRVRLINS